MGTTAWPFAITRNQTLDYRTLIAPRFLMDAGATGLLIREADADGDHPWPVTPRTVNDPNAGDLTLVFRSVAATGGLIGGEDEPLRDQVGRRIYLIEGLVVEDRNPDHEAVASQLDRVHELAFEAFRRFWGSTDIRYPAAPSDSLPLPTTRPQPRSQPQPEGQVWRPERRRRVAIVGFTVELLVSTARLTESELYELARMLERRAQSKGEHDHQGSVLSVRPASQGR